jgi:hypothetical protein
VEGRHLALRVFADTTQLLAPVLIGRDISVKVTLFTKCHRTSPTLQSTWTLEKTAPSITWDKEERFTNLRLSDSTKINSSRNAKWGPVACREAHTHMRPQMGLSRISFCRFQSGSWNKMFPTKFAQDLECVISLSPGSSSHHLFTGCHLDYFSVTCWYTHLPCYLSTFLPRCGLLGTVSPC